MTADELPPLPDAVRERLAGLAAGALPGLAPADLPSTVAHLARFTPAKRARLGVGPLVGALRTDARFRAAVVEHVRVATPELLDPDVADATGAAAAAVLLGDPRQAALLVAAGERAELSALRAELSVLRADNSRLTAELVAARAAVPSVPAGEPGGADPVADRLRARLREQGQRLRAATDELERRPQPVAAPRPDPGPAVALRAERDRAVADLAAARARAEKAERARAAALSAAREARAADEVRLQLLLDTLGGVTAGLRHELGLAVGRTATGSRPADLLGLGTPPATGGRLDSVPALDRVLAIQTVHLVVDGYNVTKTGYPQLELVAQRDRLVRDLGLLVARTSVEVTVVFDGAAVVATGGRVWARGVRVVFSPAGVIADDVVRDVVAAEPAGRPVVVVSSDREVADSVVVAGAHAVPSAVLLERLAR